MELRQLEYFRTVADMKNLTKAAQMLYISQPALSKSITALEDELGEALFERRNRKMVLTNSGQVFYRRICRILKDLDAAVSELRQISGQAPSTIAFSTIMPEFFTPIASMYAHRNPDAIISERGSTSQAAKEALVYGDAHFCLTPVAFDHPSLVWFALCDEEMLLIAPNSFRLPVTDGSVDLAALENSPFISTSGGTNLHQCTTSFCKSAGFNPRIVIESPSIDTISMLVSENCGAAFVSEIVHRQMSAPRLNPDRPPYQVLHVRSPICRRNVGIAMQKEHMLSELEFDFLKHLLFFFQPQLEFDYDACCENRFFEYLVSHRS